MGAGYPGCIWCMVHAVRIKYARHAGAATSGASTAASPAASPADQLHVLQKLWHPNLDIYGTRTPKLFYL